MVNHSHYPKGNKGFSRGILAGAGVGDRCVLGAVKNSLANAGDGVQSLDQKKSPTCRGATKPKGQLAEPVL